MEQLVDYYKDIVEIIRNRIELVKNGYILFQSYFYYIYIYLFISVVSIKGVIVVGKRNKLPDFSDLSRAKTCWFPGYESLKNCGQGWVNLPVCTQAGPGV